MATSTNWESIIPDVCSSRFLSVLLALFGLLLAEAGAVTVPGAVAVAGGLTGTTSVHRKASEPPKPPPPKAVGAAGLISVANHELGLGNYATAVEYASAAASKAPMLNDYAQFIRAEAEYRLKNYREVDRSVAQVFSFEPLSPLVGDAAVLAVTSDLEGDQPKQALDLIRKYLDRIPQPQAFLLYAKCFQANGDLEQAAEYFQRVYYQYPVAKEAAEAATLLATQIKPKLAAGYPPPMPPAMLTRAERLIRYHRASDARIELTAAIPQLGGAQRELAQVRLGEVDFTSGNAKSAFDYLNNLKVSDSEADSERLYYLIRCARRQDKDSNVSVFLDALARDHVNSSWRLKALLEVADHFRFQNNNAAALNLYQTCASVFGQNPGAVTCNWRRAYNSYHLDSADAPNLLRDYIQQFPDSEDTTDAIYFLARWYEKQSDLASARAAYDALVLHFPNTYFGILGSDRLKTPELKQAIASLNSKSFFAQVAWTQRGHYESFTPGTMAQKRLKRAELLNITGLNDFAEGELQFAARNDDGQSNVYAMQLARYAMLRNAPNDAVQYIKNYAPGYLFMPLDQAPIEFWQLAFPIPFRGTIDYFSQQQKVDPFLVAALIRQESDFNLKEVSTAHAYGLMQLLPETARSLARHFSIRRVSTSDLLTSDLSIQLGTYFLRSLLDRYSGQMEWALAAYNAGPGRSDAWRNWGPFAETADLIEVIPLHETRLYVQIVQRNANVYRRLYAGLKPDVPPYQPKPAPAKPTTRKRKKR